VKFEKNQGALYYLLAISKICPVENMVDKMVLSPHTLLRSRKILSPPGRHHFVEALNQRDLTV
jgi:hypothetical protein